MQASQPHLLVVLDDDAQAGRARVSASRAIRVEMQNLLQASTRMRPQFSQCTISSPWRSICMPRDVTVTRHAVH